MTVMDKSTRKSKSGIDIRRYFVDEGGDSTLFSRKGKVLVGTEGCSRFFILGLLDLPDVEKLHHAFNELRKRLINDPYFKGVPSMQANGRKTACAFHTKDDLPEVRKEVFSVLRDMNGLRYFAVVSDKWRVLEYVRQQNQRNPVYRYHPNELYDYLTRRLFKNQLHKDSGYEIVFSKRGKSDRTAALRQALEAVRERFAKQRNMTIDTPMQVFAGTPSAYSGLQAVDYFTWALQRLYEKNEDRYVTFLWPAFSLIQDINDNREAGYGVYYTQKKPLNTASLAWRKQVKMPGI